MSPGFMAATAASAFSPTQSLANATGRPVAFATAASGDAGCVGPTASVAFAQCTGTAWGTMHGYALFPASSGSTGASMYLAYGALNPTVEVALNDTVSFAANALTLSFA